MPSFQTLSAITIAVAAAYLGARQLLSDEAPRQLGRLPEAVRDAGLTARGRLIAGRNRARIALNEAREEQQAAEAELTAVYHQKAARTP